MVIWELKKHTLKPLDSVRITHPPMRTDAVYVEKKKTARMMYMHAKMAL